MTAKILKARAYLDRIDVTVHLDTTKMDPLVPANPDPRWLLNRTWPLPPGWQARGDKAALLNGIKSDIQAASASAIATLVDADNGGVVLSIEGATF